MKPTIFCIILLLSIYSSYSQTPDDTKRLMTAFLQELREGNTKSDAQFVTQYYAAGFANNIPLKVHLKIIEDLRKDFSHFEIVSQNDASTRCTVIIKSPFNKKKQISIVADKEDHSKISFIDIKNPN